MRPIISLIIYIRYESKMKTLEDQIADWRGQLTASEKEHKADKMKLKVAQDVKDRLADEKDDQKRKIDDLQDSLDAERQNLRKSDSKNQELSGQVSDLQQDVQKYFQVFNANSNI